jgi:glucokinase
VIWAGIDLGGTSIKAGLTDDNGKLLRRLQSRTPVDEGYEAVTRQMMQMLEKLAFDHKIPLKEIRGAGIGAPGTCSPEGLIYFANNLYWEDKPLQKDMTNLLGIPVFVENDASVGAMGEMVCGSLKGITNGILLTLGTGLGSGIVINGDVYSGSHGLGRQVGHIKVGRNFYDCTCGGNGCLETFASATALVRYYEQRQKEQGVTDDRIHQKITARFVMEAAARNEPIAVESLERLLRYLGIGIANLINTLDPELIALGGGLSKAGDQLLKPLNDQISINLYDQKRFYTKIILATLGNEAGMIGSAMFARRKINKEMSSSPI